MGGDKAGQKTEAHKREIRRSKVRRLLARGAGPSEIAAQVDVSRRTVYRDLDAIEEDLTASLDELKKGNIEDFLMELVANYDTVNEELWTLYARTDNENVKLGALKQILGLQEGKVDVLQKTGILERVAEMLEVDVTGDGTFSFNIMQVDLENHDDLKELMGGQSLDDLELNAEG